MVVSSVDADDRLEAGAQAPVSQWVYALVAPFPTILDGITTEELKSAWKGQPPAALDSPLLMDESTLGMFAAFWGQPASRAVEIVPADQLLETAWERRLAWAIAPFEALEPRWKVLSIDGQSPIQNNFDPAAYPLTVPISGPAVIPPTNRDPEKLTVVAMTGVTALVRATAWTMEQKGVLYPAQDIRDLLRGADITHISNEVPFDPGCPRADPAQPELVFCTPPDFIALLEDVGTDVVELTGDHFIDPGPAATLYTLDLYRQKGWPYYGGGATLAEGLTPAKLEHHGNKIAFVGCNAKGGGYATAGEASPGAAACGYDVLHAEIAQLRAEGYLVIATFQHQEYYSYQVKPEYRLDFTGMVDAGAVIVQGSQAHQPQNIEFYDGGFIHYGLGNLFFDQYREVGGDTLPLDRAFIDRHVFYDGDYLSTELLTVHFTDFAHSRPMTAEERQAFLEVIFKASGW
jgi:poly-gamma-glutamate synthesis protein (capsule biosynthesis protein)